MSEKKTTWTEDEIAIAKSVLAMHGQRLEDFCPSPPSEDFMQMLKQLTTPQLQWLLMEILSTIRRQPRHPR
jgi:hypothetical protein